MHEREELCGNGSTGLEKALTCLKAEAGPGGGSERDWGHDQALGIDTWRDIEEPRRTHYSRSFQRINLVQNAFSGKRRGKFTYTLRQKVTYATKL